MYIPIILFKMIIHMLQSDHSKLDNNFTNAMTTLKF